MPTSITPPATPPGVTALAQQPATQPPDVNPQAETPETAVHGASAAQAVAANRSAVGRFLHGPFGEQLQALRDQGHAMASAAADAAGHGIKVAAHTSKELAFAVETVLDRTMELGDQTPGVQAAAMAMATCSVFGVGLVNDLTRENFVSDFLPPFAASSVSLLVAKLGFMAMLENSEVFPISGLSSIAGTRIALGLDMRNTHYDPGAMFTGAASLIATAVGQTLSHTASLWNAWGTDDASRVWREHIVHTTDLALHTSLGAVTGFVMGRTLSEQVGSAPFHPVVSSVITALTAGAGALSSGGFVVLRRSALNGQDNTLSTQAARVQHEAGRLFTTMQAARSLYALALWEKNAPLAQRNSVTQAAATLKACATNSEHTELSFRDPHLRQLPLIPAHVQRLSLKGCTSLNLPDLSPCQNLHHLDLRGVPRQEGMESLCALPHGCVVDLRCTELAPAQRQALQEQLQAMPANNRPQFVWPTPALSEKYARIDQWQQSAPPGLEPHYADVARQLKLCESDATQTTLAIDNPHVTDLPDLPRHLRRLSLSGCTRLETSPSVARLAGLRELSFVGCEALTQGPSLSFPNQIQTLRFSGCNNLERLPSLDHCVELTRLDAQDCTGLSQPVVLPHPSRLTHLNLSGCTRLRQAPDAHHCNELTHFDLQGCSQISHMPNVQNCLHLQTLDMRGAPVQNLAPDWRQLPASCEVQLRLDQLAPAQRQELIDFRQAQIPGSARWVFSMPATA